MTRYRYSTLLGGKVGNWRDTRAEAVEDAITADMAWRDDHIPDRIYWDPWVKIEEEESVDPIRPSS